MLFGAVCWWCQPWSWVRPAENTCMAGIPTHGVQGIFMDRDDIRFHGRDERIGVQSFYEGQTFLYELVKILAQAVD